MITRGAVELAREFFKGDEGEFSLPSFIQKRVYNGKMKVLRIWLKRLLLAGEMDLDEVRSRYLRDFQENVPKLDLLTGFGHRAMSAEELDSFLELFVHKQWITIKDSKISAGPAI